MKRFTKLFYLVFVLCLFVFNFQFANAGFSDYNDRIITQGREASDNSACVKKCPEDGIKYYQLTTGLPVFGPNAVKCSCVPVDVGMSFFLNGILTFILGSIGTVTVFIVIIGGFQWATSNGSSKVISDAKARITNAIIGLVLTLTCGLALQVVNPKLLENQIIKVDATDIKSVPNTCGNLTASMSRSTQVCALDMTNNAFLNSNSNFSLKWRMCDIDKKNCGDYQTITQDRAAWPKSTGSTSINALCSNIKDKFGRFSINVDAISGISSNIVFRCGTDESGPISVTVKNTTGSYCACRGNDNACVSSDSDYCKANYKTDGKCRANNIQKATCFSSSILASASVSPINVDVASKSAAPYEFFCEVIGSDYSNSDYNICDNNGSCVDMATQLNSKYINPLNNSNMTFAIKVIHPTDRDFKFRCKVPYDNTFREATISADIIKRGGFGSLYYFCIGGNNECGSKNYDQLRFTTRSSYFSSSDISCSNLGKDKTSCESLKFGAYSKCYWTGTACIDFHCNLLKDPCNSINEGYCKPSMIRGGATQCGYAVNTTNCDSMKDDVSCMSLKTSGGISLCVWNKQAFGGVPKCERVAF